mmetsp:Transcript_5435/g.10526  ORF Transcript_5435/g.10526 Transcript_5435/m.10526 type:complete len:323 (-) Transcript_5435:105-1073(-)
MSQGATKKTMIRPVVGQSAPSYHGNGISSDAMPMMFIGGGDRRSEERIQYLRRSIETEPTRKVRIEMKPKKVIETNLEFTKKEKKTIWYTKKELNEMLGANKELIQMSRKNPDADVCMRGLEDMMSIRASLNKKERRNGVLHAVLEEQKKQQAEDMPNPEKLRKRSKNASKESVKRALQFAHMDARAASCEEGFESSCGSLSIPDVKKDICCSDDATIATMTTATTMTTCSTTSTFESNFRRRGGVDSVVQQPNTPTRSSSHSSNMLPTSVFIDTSGVVVDRKAKKIVLRPKEPLSSSSHRSSSGRNRIPNGSGRGRIPGGL